MKTYQLQDAKARFSEVVHSIEKEGPVIVTVHGHEKVAIISIQDFKENFPQKKKESLLDFFARSPLRGLELEIPPRDPRGGRPVDFGE